MVESIESWSRVHWTFLWLVWHTYVALVLTLILGSTVWFLHRALDILRPVPDTLASDRKTLAIILRLLRGVSRAKPVPPRRRGGNLQ